MISAERLRELLHYDPETGWFTWRVAVSSRAKVGGRAGSQATKGYRNIGLHGRRYYEHRLAVLYQTGAWPPQDVDHINMVRSDNRWSNLRLATRSENCGNTKPPRDNTSGVKGVYWNTARQKWHAQIVIEGNKTYLGLFYDIDEAAAAYAKAANDHFGEFARTA